MLEASYATGSPVGEAGCVHDDRFSRWLTDQVESLPFEISLSRNHLSAWSLSQLGPLPSETEQKLLRAITARPWVGSPRSSDGRRFRFEGRFSDLVEFPCRQRRGPGDRWVRRLPDIEGGPSPVGSARAWGDRDWRAAKAFLEPLLDPGVVGSPEDRAAVLIEHCLHPGMVRRFGSEAVALTPRGISGTSAAADVLVRVRPGVRVSIEGRNRRWEVLDRLESRDEEKFALATQMNLPTVVVAPRVTKRYREQLAEITNGLGGVVETGLYVAVSPTAVRTLEDWAPWPMVLGLPNEILDEVAAEVVAAADRFEAADAGPQVLPHGIAASWSSDGGWLAPGAEQGPQDADGRAGDVVSLVRVSDDEAIEAIRAWRAGRSGTQKQCGDETGLGYDRVRRVWAALGDGRWTGWKRSSG